MSENKRVNIVEECLPDNGFNLPAIALRGVVVFPLDVVHFDVGREISIKAVETAMRGDRNVFLIAQKDDEVELPQMKDLYKVGVIARVRQILRLPDNNLRVLVEGYARAKLLTFGVVDGMSVATAEILEDKKLSGRVAYREALVRRVKDAFHKYTAFMPKMPRDIKENVAKSEEIGFLADYIAANLPLPLDDKEYVLEQLGPVKRLETVLDILERELEICGIDAEIGAKTHNAIEENQREYYLREQMKVISNELYGDDDPDSEISEYLEKIETIATDEKVKEILTAEVKKLSKMPPGSHEGTVIRGYLDTCLQLPFGRKTKLSYDIVKAKKLLDKEHFGLQNVKDRILEAMSVYALKPDTKGHIICLAGPPGVGKTSIAKSLAKCMGRKFERISLGGIHDEAEIRGHRKTYIGSMPGKIIKAVMNAGSTNALILLDEIDKLASDYKGDPASALLEVLDAEQNHTFLDHYIDFPFDLSDLFFVTTANNIEYIPAPLLDRMDVIEIPGYLREDKFQIAKKHLLKKQAEKHGLTSANFKIDDGVLFALIDNYTREAGVRKLERSIAALCRKSTRKIAEGENKVHITLNNLTDFLGKNKYTPETVLENDEVGIINGLAWTAVGGELMQMEVLAVDGTGKIELTGSLGDVMRESAMAAVTWVRANAEIYGIDKDFYKTKDIHIHATEAAVPKDGPSAGVTMTTALVSALTSVPVKRNVAMTGEVTIRGRVLPIGGLNEKTMAAYRAGVTTVIIPKKNERDLEDINEKVRENLQFITVDRVEDVISNALAFEKSHKSAKNPPIYETKTSRTVTGRA